MDNHYIRQEYRRGPERRKICDNFHLPERRSGKDRRQTIPTVQGEYEDYLPIHKEPVIYYSDLGETITHPDAVHA